VTARYPDIALIVLDTARRDRFGCYGYDRPTTPTVDGLAAAGMQVETMIANAPWTPPSHASLFTGLYPSQHGCQWGNQIRVRDSARITLAEWLRNLGYSTVCATNNGLISDKTGLARGFDHYAFRLDLEKGLRRVSRRARKALIGGDSGGRVVNSWLRRELKNTAQPMFLFVNYVECHWSYAPPASLQRRVGGPRFRFGEGLNYRFRVADRVGPWEAIARADRRKLDILSTLYDGELANVDSHLADLLRILRAARGPLERDLLLIVTSDHGEHIGEHGLADHHASLDDHLLHVPFIAWGPNIVPSGSRNGMYELVDVFPSIAALLGHEAPAPYLRDRRTDLFLQERTAQRSKYAFAEWSCWSPSELSRLARRNPSYDFGPRARDLVCVRDGDFKFVRSSDGSESLFDLRADPQEENDTASLYPEVFNSLKRELDASVNSWNEWGQDDTGLSEADRLEIEDRLSALGYI
jgi:arylsulfatase A-like enzyme